MITIIVEGKKRDETAARPVREGSSASFSSVDISFSFSLGRRTLIGGNKIPPPPLQDGSKLDVYLCSRGWRRWERERGERWRCLWRIPSTGGRYDRCCLWLEKKMTTTDRGAPSGGRQSQTPSRLTRPIQVCPAATFPKPVICPKRWILFDGQNNGRNSQETGATLEKENQNKRSGWREKIRRKNLTRARLSDNILWFSSITIQPQGPLRSQNKRHKTIRSKFIVWRYKNVN